MTFLWVLLAEIHNIFKHTIQLMNDLIICEAKHMEPVLFEYFCTPDIPFFIQQMLAAIHFNNHFVFKANKIDNMFIHWLLTPKFQSQ